MIHFKTISCFIKRVPEMCFYLYDDENIIYYVSTHSNGSWNYKYCYNSEIQSWVYDELEHMIMSKFILPNIIVEKWNNPNHIDIISTHYKIYKRLEKIKKIL